jgi:hypothetical protein
MTEEGFYDWTHQVDIKEELNFTMAVRVADEDGNAISDPNYVEWHANFLTHDGIKVIKEESVGLHLCD